MKTTRLVAIIDDNEDDRAVYTRLLNKDTQYCWRFAEFETGEEGIEGMQQQFSCVLLDYSLPGSDGLSTLVQLLQIQPFTPVIMLTGQGNETIAASSLKQGAFDYLIKSEVTTATLTKAIDAAVASSQLKKRVAEQEKELANFARVLAHDLKQPANAISSMSQVLLSEYQDGLPEQVRYRLSLINDSAEQMSNLVQALLSYTKLEQQRPELTKVALAQCVDIALHNLVNEISDSQAEVAVAALPEIVAVPALIIQLLQILFANAILYNQQQPKIWIEAQQHGQYLHLLIKDNGIGIEDQYKQSVFEPMVRLHNSEQYKGTGLGLATALRIAQKHQGSIHCLDNELGGTTFVVQLLL